MKRLIYSRLLLLSLVIAGCSGYSSKKNTGPIPKTAEDYILEDALAGNAEAQYQVGKAYYEGNGKRYQGKGLPDDYPKAIEYLRRAANQGHLPAQYDLYLLCSRGDIVCCGQEEAAEWLKKAAGQEMPEAQYQLSRLYASGRGVEQDDNASLEWLVKAADANHVDAQYELGIHYLFGRRFFPKEEGIVEIMALVLEHHSGRELFNEHDVELGLSWLDKAKQHGSSKVGDLEPLLSMLRFMDFETGRIDTRALLREKLPEMLNDKHLKAPLK